MPGTLAADLGETLALDELTKFFRVSAETVKRWSRRGKIPPPLIYGVKWRWSKRAFERWLAQQEARAGVGAAV